LSLTVTVKVQGAVVPQELFAVQLTVVVPTGKLLPEDGVQVTDGAGVPVVPGVKLTAAEHWPAAVGIVIGLGQVIVGEVLTVVPVVALLFEVSGSVVLDETEAVSLNVPAAPVTWTTRVKVAVAPELSVPADQVTVDAPLVAP